MSLQRILFLAPLLLVLVLGCRTDPQAAPPDRPDSSGSAAPDTARPYPPAPDFESITLAGDTFRLSAQRGEVVVLNFWATWCGPCRVEIPDFIQLQKELKGEVQFVGVSLDKGGADVVRPFVEKMNINYPIIVNGGAIARRYGGIPFLPATFVIGRKGRVHHLFAGLTTRERLRPILLEMIDDAP